MRKAYLVSLERSYVEYEIYSSLNDLVALSSATTSIPRYMIEPNTHDSVAHESAHEI